MNSMNKDPNTRYTVFNTDETIFGEFIGTEPIGNGNKGGMDVIPPIPTTDGTYTLKVTITGGIPVFSWVA